MTQEADVSVDTAAGVPEGFTPPDGPPPATAETNEAAADPEETAPEAAADTQTYSAEASYFTPNRTEHEMLITLELEGETVVDANVTYDGAPAQTPNHSNFDNAYTAEVIGKNINNIELSRVGGASLTSNAFNDGVAEIKAQL
jgi:hypothetical protein